MKTTLYKKAKTGKILIWSAWLDVDDNSVPVIMRSSGQQNGKMTVKKKYVRKGTNKGKSNEKTAYEHAQFLLENMVQAKIEENMVRDIADVDMPIKYIYPALAKNFSEKKIKFPCFVQPKYDGVRCIQLNHLNDHRLLSRQRKEFKAVKHIRKALEQLRMPGNVSFDGEIYVHGFDFQDLISVVKKFYKAEEKKDIQICTEDLCYYVYDIPVADTPYLERKKLIDRYIPDNHPIIKKVPTVQANSLADIEKYHDQWVAEGYEGLIIRDKDGLYTFGDRDYSLMKYKKFLDEEYKIVGHECEEYTDTANVLHRLVIWKCITESPVIAEDGETFNVRPRGTFELREAMYNNAEDYYGKYLTVRFQEKSNTGVPRFPVGIAVRDYE